MTKYIGALALILALVMVMGLYGCVEPSPGPVTPEDNQTVYPLNATELSQANNQFAFDLYSRYKDDEGNIFFSPWSISSAFAMTYEGAQGQTADEIRNVFHFPSDLQSMETQYQSMNALLNREDKPYTLWNANSLWVEKTVQLDDDYASRMQAYYGGQASPLDFKNAPEQSRITINDWVEDKTNDRIKDLLPQGSVSPLTRLVIANAIYMKTNWSSPFEKESTYEEDFRLGSGEAVKVEMMHQRSRFNYGETEDLQILEMPYAGDELSMLVILPKEDILGGKMETVEDSLTPQNLDEWKNGMKIEDVRLTFPKYRIETEYGLKEQLVEMGMPTAFGSEADFGGIGLEEDLFISEAYHKAFVAVDEEGTEAAAATAVVIAATSMPVEQPPPKIFTADHPFIFVIQEKSTGNILFLGRVSDPR
jgi:serpin B